MATGSITVTPVHMRRPRRRAFRLAVLGIAALVAGLVLLALSRLAALTWDAYGVDIPSYYWDRVVMNPAVLGLILNTAILVGVSCALATLIAAILAWLNERTDAGIGTAGRFLPVIPFLMPAIALPLGWVFLASPRVGLLNVLIRSVLDGVGVHMTSGPLDIFTWPGLILIYTVFLTGYAYLAIAAAMRDLDPSLEEAAKMSGSGALRMLVRVVLPALRPALLNAFLISLIPGFAMVTVPLVIANGAGIDVLSVHILRLVTAQYPPRYAEAFMLGLLLLLPILSVWLLQRRSALGGRVAMIGGKSTTARRTRLGRRGRIVGRAFFLGYLLLAVALPLVGLIYVAGVGFWAPTIPSEWRYVENFRTVIDNPTAQRAIITSLTLGVVTGVLLIVAAQILTYGQRLFPRAGRLVDALVKSPSTIAHILIAIGLLIALGGPPLALAGTPLILLIGYFVSFIAFASIVATGAQQAIGRELIEAARMAGASDFRTFRRVILPLSRGAMTGGIILVFVLVSGEANVSLILGGIGMPVVGFLMVDLYEFGGFPQVAMFALIITGVVLTSVLVLSKVLGGGARRGV